MINLYLLLFLNNLVEITLLGVLMTYRPPRYTFLLVVFYYFVSGMMSLLHLSYLFGTVTHPPFLYCIGIGMWGIFAGLVPIYLGFEILGEVFENEMTFFRKWRSHYFCKNQYSVSDNEGLILKTCSCKQTLWHRDGKSNQIVDIHDRCRNNRHSILISAKCGCFSCLRIFNADYILEYVDKNRTGLCPYCSTDTILPLGVFNNKFNNPAEVLRKLKDVYLCSSPSPVVEEEDEQTLDV